MGASGPKVLFVRNGTGQTFALKYDPRKVPIPQQVENYYILAQHLPHRLPRIIESNDRAMLMEAVDGLNLHDAVMSGYLPTPQITGVFEDVLAEFRGLWVKTRSSGIPFTPRRHFPASLQRIIPAAIEALKGWGAEATTTLVVNGTELGTIQSLIELLHSRYITPSFSVLCHSDLNADNIVVTSDGQWFVTDYEWVGRYDWRRCLAHSYLWWTSTATRLETNPEVERPSPKVVEFRYRLSMPEICSELQELCLTAGQKAAIALDDPDWLEQFYLIVAGILLGEVRFVQQRDRQSYIIPVLGESLRMLAELPKYLQRCKAS